MKQLLLIACSLLMLAQASAQNNVKTILITASGGGNIQNPDQFHRSASLHISTSINYLLNEKWAVGLAAERTSGSMESVLGTVSTSSSTGYSTYYSAFETKRHAWFVGPQARYYHTLTQKLFLFGEAQAGIGFESAKTESNAVSYYSGNPYYYLNGNQLSESYSTNKSTAVSLQAMASPGMVYWLKPRFGVELKTSVLQYTHNLDSSQFPDGAEHAKNFTADFSLANCRLGVDFSF